MNQTAHCPCNRESRGLAVLRTRNKRHYSVTLLFIISAFMVFQVCVCADIHYISRSIVIPVHFDLMGTFLGSHEETSL